MDSFDYEIKLEKDFHKNSQDLVELAPRLRRSLERSDLPMPTYVSLSRGRRAIILYYSTEDYRQLSWLFRIFLGTKISRFENDNTGQTQRLITEGKFPRWSYNPVNVVVSIDVGLRSTCRVEYENKTIKVAKIVCNETPKDIEGVSISSLGGG